MIDNSIFPDATYKRTVLAPLFEGAKAYFVSPVRAINQAHLVMLVDTGIVTQADGKAIAEALLDIDSTVDVESLVYTGEHEDYFFLVESELHQRLGSDIAGMLHTARSRNDMDHTVFKIALRSRTDAMLEQTAALANMLINKVVAERDTLVVAYTHGQPAQPSTYGHYLAAALEVLLRDFQRLQFARVALDNCPMGAAAITTSGFAIDRQRMATLLGFEQPLLNSYGCIASVDYVTGLYSAIKLLFLHLGRVIQDMQFWTAFEVGQLYVPNSLVQISSIMPQKRNPVPIEHLRHLASMTCGRCDAMINTMHNTPFTDMNDSEGEVQTAGYAVFASAERVLALFSTIIDASSINHDRVTATTDAACITVTELADTLVREEGLSFRQAHEIAAVTSQAVIASKQSLHAGFVDFKKAFLASTGRESALLEPAYQNAVSARTFVNVRTRPGGPAPAAMDAAITEYQHTLQLKQAELDTQKRRIGAAEKTLADAFAQLVGG